MKTVLNWSSGKDAALAYHLLLKDDRFEVTHLLTTINETQDRIVMHGVREALLEAQAQRMKLPLKKIRLPESADDRQYKTQMLAALEDLKKQGVRASAFGDIFLEDLRNYREQQLTAVNLKAVFPLWQKNTYELAGKLSQEGIEAIIVCVDERSPGKDFLGRKVDASLLRDLPPGVDPCGENGEFHTFVYNAPFFASPVLFITSKIVYKKYNEGSCFEKGFYFLDLLTG